MLTFFTFQCVAESRPSEENVAVDNVDTVSIFLQSRFASNLRHIDPGQHIGFDQVTLQISAVECQGVYCWLGPAGYQRRVDTFGQKYMHFLFVCG